MAVTAASSNTVVLQVNTAEDNSTAKASMDLKQGTVVSRSSTEATDSKAQVAMAHKVSLQSHYQSSDTD